MTVVLSTLSLVQITDLYNLIADKPVKKFENKAKGLNRLEALLVATQNEVFVADGEYDVRPTAQELAKVISLTDLEYGMMDVIAHAEHNTTNGATPTKHSEVHTWLWADEFGKSLGIGAQAAGGVLSSLEQKGAIWTDVSGKKDDHAVAFTPDGFAAWQADHESGRKFTVQKRAVARVKGGKRGPAPEFADDMVIDVLVANPKKNGSAARVRFDLYKNGMTVAQFLAAGGTRADLAWDSDPKRSFIAIGRAH